LLEAPVFLKVCQEEGLKTGSTGLFYQASHCSVTSLAGDWRSSL
jgi:hypothetical protein